jgi:hypothetical protein
VAAARSRGVTRSGVIPGGRGCVVPTVWHRADKLHCGDSVEPHSKLSCARPGFPNRQLNVKYHSPGALMSYSVLCRRFGTPPSSGSNPHQPPPQKCVLTAQDTAGSGMTCGGGKGWQTPTPTPTLTYLHIGARARTNTCRSARNRRSPLARFVLASEYCGRGFGYTRIPAPKPSAQSRIQH